MLTSRLHYLHTVQGGPREVHQTGEGHVGPVIRRPYHQCETVVRRAAGTSEPFGVEAGLYQGSASSPFLFACLQTGKFASETTCWEVELEQ